MTITFILFYVFFKEDKIFYKRVWWTFFVPVIFIPLLIFPELAYKFSIVEQDGRFYGLFQNPSDASLFFLIALSFFFVLFLKNFYQKRGYFCLAYFLLTVTMASLVLWSQARAAWFGMIGGLMMASYLVIIAFRKNLLKNLLLNAVIIILILILAFAILPSSAKIVLILRIFPQYNHYVREKVDDVSQLSSQNLGDLISKIKRENASPDLFYDQPRLAIWKDYLKLIPKNPLGLGLNYYHPELAVKLQGKPLGGYHNLLLECWTYGGITALGAFLYLLWRIILNIKNKIRDNSKNPLTIYNIGIASALFGLIIHSLFGGLIFFYFVWILLAMALI